MDLEELCRPLKGLNLISTLIPGTPVPGYRFLRPFGTGKFQARCISQTASGYICSGPLSEVLNRTKIIQLQRDKLTPHH
jgi:hypothetical protein